jgi:DnaJ-class molecular chaperone
MAVGTFITQPDDSWKCVRCTQRDKVITPPGQQMVAVTCPTCSGADRACATCSGLGKVRVPMSQLNPYDPAGQQVLTEG